MLMLFFYCDILLALDCGKMDMLPAKHVINLTVLLTILCLSRVVAAAPEPVSPIDQTDTESPVFIWTAEEGITRYRLLLWDQSSRSQIHLRTYQSTDICAGSLCSVQPEVSFGFGVNHRWRLRTRDIVGWNSWGENWFFDYSDTPPGEVTLLGPDGLIDTDEPTFSWQHETDATTYRLLVQDKDEGSQIHLTNYSASDICAFGLCSVTPENLLLPQGNRLFFRVRARNTGGWNSWSAPGNFEYETSGNTCETFNGATSDDLCAPPVIISEFVASNQANLVDATGKYPDWIELHNNAAEPVDLSGWTLSAGSDTHVFSGTIIEADEYLIIFASGDPDRSTAGELHVDFKLSAGGESLVLTDDDGTLSAPSWVSDYPEQRSDISYGIDDTGAELYFNPPTPGEPNINGVAGFVEPVTFSLDHGFYNDDQSVVLSTATPSATIYYTLDGSTPSASNGLSVPPGTSVVVNQTTVIRAIAARNGWTSLSLIHI